jgi:hypothetical protein
VKERSWGRFLPQSLEQAAYPRERESGPLAELLKDAPFAKSTSR